MTKEESKFIHDLISRGGQNSDGVLIKSRKETSDKNNKFLDSLVERGYITMSDAVIILGGYKTGERFISVTEAYQYSFRSSND